MRAPGNSADQNQVDCHEWAGGERICVDALQRWRRAGRTSRTFSTSCRTTSSFDRAHYWGSNGNSSDSSALSYIAETPWNDTCASSILSFYVENGNTDPTALCSDTSNRANYLATAGGGGGVSIFQPRPSWQNGTVYGIPAASGTYNFRLLPDVSLMAANGIWSHALDYYQSDVSTSLQRAGGTSFVAPQLAGVFALIAQKTGQRLGQPDYVLYNMAGAEYGTTSYTPGPTCNGSGTTSNTGTTSTVPASTCIFYDIFTGNNAQACTSGTPNCYDSTGTVGIFSTSTGAAQVAYPSGEGYDLATGIGSLNIANLVNNWQNAAAGGIAYTPAILLNATAASYTYGQPSSITYTATVSGPGSFPTGSVTFSGSGAISTIGNDALAESSGCASGGSCTESTTQSYTPPGTLTAGSYTITGTYLTTNENYASGNGTTTLTVNKQTPAVTVSAAIVGLGVATANLSANVAYSGSGVAPTDGLTFQVDSGSVLAASCTGSSSPLTCSASYPSSTLTLGSHTITATSLADTNYASASGSRHAERADESDDYVYGGEPSHAGPGVYGERELELRGDHHVLGGEWAGDDGGQHGDADRRSRHGDVAGLAGGERQLCRWHADGELPGDCGQRVVCQLNGEPEHFRPDRRADYE